MQKIWNDQKQEDVFSKYLDHIDQSKLAKKIKLDTQFPMLVTEEGHIICVETNKRDQVRAGFFGKIRSGKSLALNRFFNRHYWIGGRRSLWLNDKTDESFFHENPMSTPKFIRQLSTIGEKTCYTPYVHLFPHMRNSIPVRPNGSIVAEFCFELHKCLDKPKLFFELQRSERYLKALKQKLVHARTKEEVEELFSKIKMKLSSEKIKETFQYHFDEEIFDITASGKVFCKGVVIDKKTGSRKNYPVMVGAMLLDACVSVHTKYLVQKDYIQPYSELELRDIINYYQNDKFVNSIPAQIAIDEIHSISSTEKINEAIQEIAKQGTLNIGLFYANQSYKTIDKHLKKNTRMAFCFGFGDRLEAKELVDNFSVEKEYVNQILTLNREKHECVLFTDEEVYAYDVENNEKYVISSGAIKGICLPPPSNNKTPGASIVLNPLV